MKPLVGTIALALAFVGILFWLGLSLARILTAGPQP